MDYLRALATLYRDGNLPKGTVMRSDLLQAILQDRLSMTKNGYRLWIEPEPSMQETIYERGHGKRLVKYAGFVVFAFEKDGQFYPFEGAKPFSDRSSARENGTFSFLIDSSGMIVGFGDDLTGNDYGELKTSQRNSKTWILILTGIILLTAFFLRVLK